MIRLLWIALWTYFIIAVAAFAFYVVAGLNVLDDSPVPLGARLLAIPLLVLEAPIWYVRDAFAPALPSSTSVLRVVGGVVASAAAIIASRFFYERAVGNKNR